MTAPRLGPTPARAAELAAMLTRDEDNGYVYTGPLDEARQLVVRDRQVGEGMTVTRLLEPTYEVLLCDLSPDHVDAVWDNAREWGRSGECRPEEAWRLALGSYFAPGDHDLTVVPVYLSASGA